MIYSRPYFNLRKYCSQLFLRSPRNVFNFINDITTIFFTHKHGFVSFLQNKYIHKESTSHPWCKVFRIDPCPENSRTYPHWSYHAKGRHYTCMYYFPFENWFTSYEVINVTSTIQVIQLGNIDDWYWFFEVPREIEGAFHLLKN